MNEIMLSYPQSYASRNIIHCAPQNATDICAYDKIGKIKSLSSIHRLYNFRNSICPHDRTAKKLTHFLSNNISGEHSKLRELEMASITAGYPIGQFIIDTYFKCVLLYNWTINEFMGKSALFANIPKDNKQMILIRSYLKQYLQYVSMPINKQMGQVIDGLFNSIDDDEVDHTTQPSHSVNYKHDMRRILRYISQFKFSLPTTPPRSCKKVFRQIDAIFIPECERMNATFIEKLLVQNSIEYKEIDASRLYTGLRNIEHLVRYADFSRCVILIIGDDNTDIGGEKIYLFKMPIDDAVTDMLFCSELPWIYNTGNNAEWLKKIITECNGITFSYHMHSKHVQRVYLSYETSDNQHYSTRVFKHNVIHILKIFCHDIDVNDIKLDFDKAEYNDVQYTEFINRYFSDLKLLQYDNYYRMNELIKEYYKTMRVAYNDNFIKYMDEHGFTSDEQLEDILGKDVIDYNDCTVVEFDKQFPIQKKSFFTRNEDRYCFIFHFLQHCYVNNTIPTQKEMDKCNSIGHAIDNTGHDAHIHDRSSEIEDHVANNILHPNICVPGSVPGGYGYRGEGGAVMMVYGRNNNNSQKSSDQPKKNDDKESNNNRNKPNRDKMNDKNKQHRNNKNGDDKKDEEEKKADRKPKNEKRKNKDAKSLYRIPRKLTKEIPKMIIEPIEKPYIFMIDKLRLLSVNNGIYELTNGDRIVNFDFHDKMNEILYGYAKSIDPKDNRGFKWEFDEILYTTVDIKGKYKINPAQLPTALTLNNLNNAPTLTKNDIKSFIDNNKWAKVIVHNINSKDTNKRKLTLALTVEQFKKNLKLNGSDVADIIPILTCSKNKGYCMEYVWIVSIETGVDIGISFKCESNCKIVTGIYVDKQTLLRRHMVVRPHKCHCLDNKFVSTVSCLQIGNVAETENKLKDLQQRNDKMKKENINLRDNNHELKQENANLQRDISELEMKISSWMAELKKCKALALQIQQSNDNILETNQSEEDGVNKTEALSVDATLLTDDTDAELDQEERDNNVLKPPPISIFPSLIPIPIMGTMSSSISAQTPMPPNSSNIAAFPSQSTSNGSVVTPQYQQQPVVLLNSMNNQSSNIISSQSVPFYGWPPVASINTASIGRLQANMYGTPINYFTYFPPPEFFNQQISKKI